MTARDRRNHKRGLNRAGRVHGVSGKKCSSKEDVEKHDNASFLKSARIFDVLLCYSVALDGDQSEIDNPYVDFFCIKCKYNKEPLRAVPISADSYPNVIHNFHNHTVNFEV